jgi:hypothetical protein
MRSTISILFYHACMVESEGAGVTGIFQNVHVHPQSTFFHLEDRSLQPPDSADRSRQRPRDQLFILCVGICIPYPAVHETTITPLADSIPGFCDLEVS